MDGDRGELVRDILAMIDDEIFGWKYRPFTTSEQEAWAARVLGLLRNQISLKYRRDLLDDVNGVT